MSQPPPERDRPFAPGSNPPPDQGASPWSPSVRSAVYLPVDAPSRPGPWHLPQVRAQALGTLIEDVCGWVRNLHGLLVVLLGVAGGGALVLATSGIVTRGVLLWLLTSIGVLALLVWAIWGVWLERTAWRAIAATGRWHAAYIRGTGASGHVITPSVRDVFTSAMIVRLLFAVLLLAGAVWIGLIAADGDGPPTRTAALGVVTAVLAVGGLSALATGAGMVAAFRRRPTSEARARAQGLAGFAQPGQHAHPDQHAQSGQHAHPGQHGQYVQHAHPGQHPQHPQYEPPLQVRRAGIPYGDDQPHQQSAEPGPVPAAGYGSASQAPFGASSAPAGQVPGPGAASSGPPGAGLADPSANQPFSSPQGAPTVQSEDGGYGGEELEQTRLAARLGPAPSESRTRESGGIAVVLPDGRHVSGDATSLLGRDPRPRPDESVDGLVKLADQSVSKTHLALRVSANQVWATDRASTNGTVLEGPDGSRMELPPWEERFVPVGSTLTLGSTRIQVLLTSDLAQ